MSEIKLPEMPRAEKLFEDDDNIVVGYYKDQIEAYARAAVELDRASRPAVCAKCKGRGVVDDNVDVDDNGGSIGTVEPCSACASRPSGEAVAWRTFDGEGGYELRNYEDNEDYLTDWNRRNPHHIGWVQPLYLAPLATPAAGEAALQAEKDRDFLVEEYERAVECGKQGYLHCAMHLFNAITNARIDARLAVSEDVRDAKRYRWLREIPSTLYMDHDNLPNDGGWDVPTYWPGGYSPGNELQGRDLDDAIDEAIAKFAHVQGEAASA